MKKKLKEIAKKIVELEKEVQFVTSLEEKSHLEQKIMDLISSCSIEDILEIDNYILKEKLLTK